MNRKDNTKILFLLAIIVIGMMVGYRLWKFKQRSVMCEKPVSKNGVVTGVILAADKPSAVVGCEIVYEGDTIHGVKVIRICSDEVQFDKDGKSWTQKVNGPQNRAWPKEN